MTDPQTPATEDRNYSSTESHRLMAQTPATEAGRRLLEFLYPQHGGAMRTDAVAARILAIEAEARAEHWNEGYRAGYSIGRADALREAADAMRAALGDTEMAAAVLAILDPDHA